MKLAGLSAGHACESEVLAAQTLDQALAIDTPPQLDDFVDLTPTLNPPPSPAYEPFALQHFLRLDMGPNAFDRTVDLTELGKARKKR